MKKLLIGIATLSVLASCSNKNKVKLTTEEDKVSYAIGLDIAKSFRQNKLDTLLNSEAIGKGIVDGLAKNPEYLLNPDSAVKFLERYTKKLREKQQASESKKYEKNIEIGKKFLEDNKKQAGIVVLPSGLQYKIEKAGNGAKPTAKDVVKVNYKGTFIDGKVFDSSYERKEPATFPVAGGIIQGWSEILQIMPVGSKWTVYIPQELAYGANLDGRIPVPPYSTLIFEIELLSIEKQ
jgi:FKBP-type peptidyl-prolyl cis-trans isomerase FklB